MFHVAVNLTLRFSPVNVKKSLAHHYHKGGMFLPKYLGLGMQVFAYAALGKTRSWSGQLLFRPQICNWNPGDESSGVGDLKVTHPNYDVLS